MEVVHYVKSVRIRSFSDLYFPVFGLNTERYSVFLRIQSGCGKIRTRKTPNIDTFQCSGTDKKVTVFNFPTYYDECDK